MKLRQILKISLLTSSVCVLATNPAFGEEKQDASRQNIPNRSASLLVQSSAEVVEVTAVKVTPTDNGVEIILETTKGDQLQVLNRSSGNSYIADIPNAQLRLPNNNTFRQQKPVAGITEITVTNQDANSIRVVVTGETIPTVELFDSDEGLIFGFTKVAPGSTPQPEQPAATTPQPEQPTSETQPEQPAATTPQPEQPAATTPQPEQPAATTPQPEQPAATTPQPEQPTSETEQEQPAAEADEPIEVLVTDSQDSGYNAPDASTATRTDTPLIDIPQAIQVVPRQVIEDQKVQRVADVLRNVSGVTPSINLVGADTYTIRGFNTNANLRNGFRQDNFTAFTDSSTIERIEVLKGPASVLYGQLEPGGIVNYITKQPLNEPYYSATFSVGSYSYYRPEIDISGPLTQDNTTLYRFIAAYENSGGFRDFAFKELYTFAPSLTVKLGDSTNLDLQYEYLNLNQSYDRGLMPTNQSFNLPISFNFGEPSDRYDLFGNRVNVALAHRFSENWRFRSGVSVQTVDDFRTNFQPVDLADEFSEDDPLVPRRYNDVESNTREYAWQNDLVGKFKTGSIEHELLLGLELSRTDYDYTFLINYDDVAPLNFLNPVYGASIPTTFDEGYLQESNTNRVGLYVQDQIALLPELKVLLGGRLDFIRYKNESTANDYDNNTSSITNTQRYYEAFSPRIGLVYQPIKNLSLYASYTRSFKPNESAIDINLNPLEPERGTQYEVGVKSEFLDGKLTATLAVYEITKTNVAASIINNEQYSEAVGEVKSRGIELDITGEILPGWNIIASYAHNDAYVTEDTDLSKIGDRLENAPRDSASLWTTYQIQSGNLKGLGFGAGLFFIGDREATLPNTIEIPSYVRTDATIFYRQPNYEVGLSFKNLFDVKYYDSQGYLLSPGAPFTVLGTVSVKF